MDANIRQSIEVRKTAITNIYELNADLQKKFDSLFEKIEELGKTAKDVADFEDKFQKSPLNTEYMNFFTEIATSGATLKSGVVDIPKANMSTTAKASGTSVGTMVSESVMETAGSRIKQAVVPTRASVHQAAYDKARDLPGVGEALSVKQHVDFFSRFKKK
jgi:hypothetical protein